MHRFRGVQEARRQTQTGAGGTDFRAHQSAFAHARNHQVSLAGDQQLHGLGPGESLGFVGVQPLGQGQHGFAFGSECVQHPFMHGQRISHWSACIVPRRMGSHDCGAPDASRGLASPLARF